MEESLAPVENSGEDVLSMIDVLKEENELEEEANAVLGDSDDQNCTYPMVKNISFQCIRQFVFTKIDFQFVYNEICRF